MKLATELEDLQKRLAMVDLLTAEEQPSGDVQYIQIYSIQNLKFRMRPDTRHERPHLHIDYGRHYRTASFSINPAEKLAGSISTKHSKIVIEWVDENRDTWLKLWTNLQEGKEVSPFVESLRGNA